MLRIGLKCKFKIGSRYFHCLLKFYSVWGMFRNTNSVNLFQNSVFAKLSGCQNEVFKKKIAYFVFVVFMLLEEKQKNTMENPKT